MVLIDGEGEGPGELLYVDMDWRRRHPQKGRRIRGFEGKSRSCDITEAKSWTISRGASSCVKGLDQPRTVTPECYHMEAIGILQKDAMESQ